MNIQQETPLDITHFQKLTKQIEKERKLVKKILSSTQSSKAPIQITTVLMIVESPTKAKTIASFFGKPAKRLLKNTTIYETIIGDKILLIGACMGHIVDLPTKPYLRGVKVKKNKFIPTYETIKICKTTQETITYVDEPLHQKCFQTLDKKQIIYDLQDIGEEVDEIYLASDPDIEGEKIAFDLYNLLKPLNPNIYRIEYHQVTKSAILDAIDNKRQIDIDWVKAQIVRRIADRFVGFALSQKLQQVFGSPNYSAGRVQTPVLGWIIKRDQQVSKKILEIKLNIQNHIITFREENLNLEAKLKNTKYILIELLSNNQKEIAPYPPFTTDSLLSAVSDKLKWSPEYIMNIAQSLFEKGLITYHRTDSNHISVTGINIAKTYLQLNDMEYFFKPRPWGPQSAHEGIRPTKPLDNKSLQEWASNNNVTILGDEIKLYDIIFSRFIASQTKNALIVEGEFKIKLLDQEQNIIISYNLSLPIKIIEPYWTLFWPHQVYSIIPGQYLFKGEIKKVPKKFYYSFSELIQQMKQQGLGRPSTYAMIIHTLIKRKYVIKILQKYLKHTIKGEKIYNYLAKLYSELISEKFTAILESQMNQVEKGANHHKVIGQLFEKLIDLKLISYQDER